MPEVHFEPIDETIECGDDETILDAAIRAGYSLVYGCREGQCSACKVFLLEGEVSLKRYSTFALSESEQEQGYTLLCRAMPDEDVDVELLHFDPDDYKLRNPIVEGTAQVTKVEQLTRDIYRLVLDDATPSFEFLPGQYLDLVVPGSADRRSFSLASLPGQPAEFVVKHYDGGRFSGMLADGSVCAGTEIGFVGPYGSFHLRETDRPIVMVAGGSGMAPMLGLLRQLAVEPPGRPVRVYYGCREEQDLFDVEVVAELVAAIDDCTCTTVLNAQGFVHEVASAELATAGLGEIDLYLCGPPPMVEGAIELFSAKHGVPDERIHYDKFTTAADAAEEA